MCFEEILVAKILLMPYILSVVPYIYFCSIKIVLEYDSFVGVWVYGCTGVWVYGCMGVYLRGRGPAIGDEEWMSSFRAEAFGGLSGFASLWQIANTTKTLEQLLQEGLERLLRQQRIHLPEQKVPKELH
jgi:hypothetical protein